VNIGAICAKFPFLHVQPTTDHYNIPYIYGASVLLIAASLFLIGYRYYIHVKPRETVIMRCIPVTINAFQNWHQHHKNNRSKKKVYRASSSPNLVYSHRVIIEDDEETRINQQVSTFLDYAKAENNGKYIDRIVEDVKSLRGAFAVFILLIPYWLIYDQAR
jgi:CRISPR/Cas system-associated protein Csm6